MKNKKEKVNRVQNKTKTNSVLNKIKKKEKEEKILEKCRDLFVVAQMINCNYSILQSQLLEILNLYGYKYVCPRDIYIPSKNDLDTSKQVHNKGDLIKYKQELLYKLIRELKSIDCLDTFYCPIPSGKHTVTQMIRFKHKAVNYYLQGNIKNKKECTRPSNKKCYSSLLRAELLIHNVDYFKSIKRNNNNTFWNVLDNTILFYKYFIDNNINKHNNEDTLKAINEFIKIEKGEKQIISKSILSLAFKDIYLLNYYEKFDDTYGFDLIITNPSGTGFTIDYVKKIVKTINIISDVFNKNDSVQDENSVINNFYYVINIIIVTNNDFEKTKVEEYIKRPTVDVQRQYDKTKELNKKTANKYKGEINFKAECININKYGREVERYDYKTDSFLDYFNKCKEKIQRHKKIFDIAINYYLRTKITYSSFEKLTVSECIKLLEENNYEFFGIDKDTGLVLVKPKNAEYVDFNKLYDFYEFDIKEYCNINKYNPDKQLKFKRV